MDIASLITIGIAILLVYFFIRLVVSPVIRFILGVIMFLIILYALKTFGFDFNKILSPLGISLDINGFISKLDWVLGPLKYYIDQIKYFINNLWS